MEFSEAVDECLADANLVTLVRRDLGRHFAADGDASAALHEVEGHTEDGLVFAEKEDPGGGAEVRSNLAEDAVFARHIMSLRWHGPQRWAAENVFGVAG